MKTRRCTAASVVMKGQLFVLGGYYGTGRVREIERYDKVKNNWNLI